MLNRLKDWLGATEPVVSTGPLGLVVGGSWRVELFNIRANPTAYHFTTDDASAVIVAYGKADLGDGMCLHRFYAQDDHMLQLICPSDDPATVQEITLYQPFDSIHPNSAEAWQAWLGPQGWMRQPTYELDDGTCYQRTWFADDPGTVELVQFSETLCRTRGDGPTEHIQQQCMLYNRDIAHSPPEHLLVICETNDAGRSIELMIGIDLQLPQLTVF